MIIDTLRVVSDTLPDVSFDWLTRAIDLPFVGPLAIALLSVICVVGAFLVWALAVLIVVASAVVTDSVIQAAPIFAAIVNFMRPPSASLGL